MSKVYISKEMIEDGLMAGIIIPELDDDGLKAHIGDFWFYFGGNEFEYTEPDDIPFDVLVNELKWSLSEFNSVSKFKKKYEYCYSYLVENT